MAAVLIDPRDDTFPQSEIDRTALRAPILRFARKNAVGAEFGVFRGHFSEVLVRVLTPSKLFLVDPWTMLGEGFGWGEDDPYTNYGKLTTLQAREDTRRRIAAFPTCELREQTLEAFCGSFDGKLDWAYLDTTHGYTDTLRELEMLRGILAPDGVILGDDWSTGSHAPQYGVRSAVNDFVRRSDFDIIEAGTHLQFALRRAPQYKG